MRLSISTRRGWILPVVAALAIGLLSAQVAWAQDPPEIITHPESAVVCDGGAVTFTVVAIGDLPLEFQWYEDGAPIFGADESDFTIDPVGFGAAADYTVIVSNAYGSVESDPATLTVIDTLPSIIDDPQDAEVCAGAAVSFTVTADGEGPLRYQWRRNGISIFGADDSSYTIDPVGVGAAADYSVVVSNPCGSVESGIATLTVHAGASITVHPQSTAVCEDGSVTLWVVASGFGPLDYQWRKDGADLPGEESNTLVIDPVTTGDAGDYDVVVTDDCGSVTSNAATVTVRVAPSIVTHPDDVDACVGQGNPVEFEVVATGSGPLSYQWYQNGALIAGATSSIYSIDEVELGDAGDYYVIVSNDCDVDGVQSDTATLVVNVGPTITEHPESQVACDGDAELSFSVTAIGSDPLAYQWRKDGVGIPGAESATYTISPVTPTDAGVYDVFVINMCGSQVSDAAVLTVVDVVPDIVEQPQGAALCADDNDSITFSVTATPADGLTYQWRLDGVDIPNATASTYTIDDVEMGHAGDYDVVVSNPCGDTLSDAATLIVVDEWPSIAGQPQGDIICEGQAVTFTVTAEGPEPLTYQWYFGGGAIGGATDSSYEISSADPSDSGNYRVEVTNPCATISSAQATLTVNDTAPSIVEQPQPVTACEGANVSFSVVADGDPPFEYQWYKDGQPLAGATDASYSATDITVADAGDYSVTVTNVCGSADSDAATLTVNTAVVITEQPTSQQLCEGSLVIFSVQTTGTGPISYQWYKDGEELDGETQAAYTIAAITPAHAGAYSVEVTNVCASVTSESATLTVDVGPTITQHPTAPELCVGESVTLTVVATGTEPFTYQWYKDDVPIGGAVEAEFTIDSLSTDDTGDYHAVVTNLCDQAASDAASVVVDEPPLIVGQPAAAIIAHGQTNVFCVTVDGTEPFEYQWRKDGVNIAGATSNCYETGEAGTYSAVVTNRCGQAVSNGALLTIAPRLIVSVSADPAGLRLGSSSTVTATAERGLAPYAYEWSTGETTASIVVTPTENTVYSVLATDALGQTAMAEVTVVVAAPLVVQTRASAYMLWPGESSTLTASVLTGGLVPFTYVWNTGETTPSIVVSPTVDTTYSATITDSLGQTGSASVTITVNVESDDDQDGDGQPPPDDSDDGDQPPDDGDDDGDDGTDDGTDDDDQSGQDSPLAGLCPLTGFGMIGLLVAGLLRTRSTRRRR